MKKINKKTAFALYAVVFTLLIGALGIGYAWFSANIEVIGEASNSIIARTANLGLVTFQNGNTINASYIYPSWCDTKRVSIESDSNETENNGYRIYVNVTRNTFAEYGSTAGYITVENTLVSDESQVSSGTVGYTDLQDITITSGKMQILSGVIAPNETHTYDLEFCFPELMTNQNSQKNKEFSAYISVEADTTQAVAYCTENNIQTLRECLIRNDSKQELAEALT